MTSCVVINPSLTHRNTASNATTVKGSIENKSENQSSNSGFLEINTQLKPLLIKEYENKIAFDLSKCYKIIGCPLWIESESTLEPNLSTIGNVSSYLNIHL